MKTIPTYGSLIEPRLDNMSETIELLLNHVVAPGLGVVVSDFSQLETVAGKGYLAKGTAELHTLDNAYLGKLTMVALRPGEGTGVLEDLNGQRIPGMFTNVKNPSVVVPRDKNKESPIAFREYFIPFGTFKTNNFYFLNSLWMSGYEQNDPTNRVSFIKTLGINPEPYVTLVTKSDAADVDFSNKLDFTLDNPINPLEKDSWMKRFGAYHSVVAPSYYPEAVQIAGFFQLNADNFEVMTESGIITYINREVWEDVKSIRSLDELN